MREKVPEHSRTETSRQLAAAPRLTMFSRIPCMVILVVSLFLGNCSAWRPSAAESGKLGKAALRSGDYTKAREHFEAALKTSPLEEDARVGLLEAFMETGAYQEAERKADELLGVRESAGVLFKRGELAAERGDYADAEKRFRRALELGGPQRREAALALADLLASLGRKAEAEPLWDGVIEEYRAGRVHGSAALGQAAVAAWRRGYVQDAKDIFVDATNEKAGDEVSLDALSNFGFLFLEKYNATDAMDVFKDCLKINKSYPEALLGMALAKEYEGGGEAYAQAALAVNPNLVGAINFLAEQKIQDEDYDGALKDIRRALAVNPADLESLSLEAVCHTMKGDTARFADSEKRILAINPSYGRFYFTLAENMVAHRKYQEAIEFDRKAISIDSRLWPAYTSLGMNLTRVGDLAGGRKAIQQAFDGDPFNVWAYNSLELLDQLDTFKTRASEHYSFRLSAEDDPIVGPYAVKLGEEVYAKLTARYGFSPKGPIDVEFFPDHGGFAVRTLGLPGLGALGVCFGKVIALDSPRARKAGTFNWGTTLWHEFTHVITLQMTNHNIPRWYSEGLSVYEEHRARPGWGEDLTAGFIKAYKEGKLLKVSELTAGMQRPKSPEQVGLSYYQASLVCNLIEEKFGFEKIKQTLHLFAQGKSTDEVFREALGWNTAELDREYLRYLDDRLKVVASHLNFRNPERDGVHAAVPGPSDKLTLAAALQKDPEDFFANLQMGALLRKENANREAEEYLKKAQQIFPEFTEPGNPYQLLAEMYREQKRKDEALAEFLAWSKIDEDALAPLVGAGEIYQERKNWTSLAAVLEQSVYVDPYDQSVHKKLGAAAMEVGDWPSATASYQVLVELNPTDPAGAHYDLARAWLAAGKKLEAKRETLRALEIAPSFDKAQQLLLRLSGGNP